jgi:hypothetical protein
MRCFLVLLLAATGLPGHAQQAKASISHAAQPVQLTTFTDASNSVSFQYPSIWRRVPKPDAMTQPSLLMAGHKPILDVEFSPQGNLYARTNLVALDFSYYTEPAQSRAACAALGNPDSENRSVTTTINGIPYSHRSGGEGGMCHEISSEVYATWRAGTCHLFEEDFMTLCAGVVDGTRALTPRETKALQRHLDQIMRSVTFTGP